MKKESAKRTRGGIESQSARKYIRFLSFRNARRIKTPKRRTTLPATPPYTYGFSNEILPIENLIGSKTASLNVAPPTTSFQTGSDSAVSIPLFSWAKNKGTSGRSKTVPFKK